MRHNLLLLLVALVSSWPASAEQPTSVTVRAGEDVRIGYYSVFKRDCSAGLAPEVRITQLPRHGTVTLRTGALATKRVPNCPESRAPATLVFYRAAAGYAGQDFVGYEVVGTTGAPQPQTVTITVTSPAQPI